MSSWELPRVVLVTRPTEYELLLARHATRGQAAFFLETRGQRIEEVERRHERFGRSLASVLGAIPSRWRRVRVGRADLERFVFEPSDIVVALGQDGLVANLAKYLFGQPVIGLNPDPESYDGILVPHAASRAERLIVAAGAGRVAVERRTMVEARLDDGQRLLALNEVFAGHRSHQSARYRICWRSKEERHSSSGLIVASGTGATGWARSIAGQRSHCPTLPGAAERKLAFLVREPFPSVATGTELQGGLIEADESLCIVSEMNEEGVIFGDGIESDTLDFQWGMALTVRVAEERLCLVRGAA